MNNKWNTPDLVELDTGQLMKINGGVTGPYTQILISYFIIDIALNPVKSYNAFMAGWNSF